MMNRKDKPKEKEVPATIYDKSKRIEWKRGRFLGKGGFARCYELENAAKKIVAGKVVSKQLLQKSYQKDKMVQEIQIHRGLAHDNIVKLTDYFEDDDNVYVILELCANRSLMELHKRRKGITEPEARYFTKQVTEGVAFLHAKKIVHRDLKLGNLFLNNEMQVKIGDFGLAANVTDGGKRKTLCGTPNYIAPEVLTKSGHSYECDVWAIGCILFTLLTGAPPFETKELKETYQRIKDNKYRIPCWVNKDARDLITTFLSHDPKDRPTTGKCLTHAFFSGHTPSRLPVSCLTLAPKFDAIQAPPGPRCTCCKYPEGIPRAPVIKTEAVDPAPSSTRKTRRSTEARALQAVVQNVPEPMVIDSKAAVPPMAVEAKDEDEAMRELHEQLVVLLQNEGISRKLDVEEQSESPRSAPVYWISKWVDYSDKYGIGYQLCDNSVGVLFNDQTKITVDAARHEVAYMDKDMNETYYTMKKFPGHMDKKIKLLRYFSSYMDEHLLSAGATQAPKAGDELARLPCLRMWFRTKSAIVLHLSNGTIQMNFHNDHKKLILDPFMGAATFIDADKSFRVFSFDLLKEHGCPSDLYTRLRYAKTMVERLRSKKGTQGLPSRAEPPLTARQKAMATEI